MKKLLGWFGSIFLTAPLATVTIACGKQELRNEINWDHQNYYYELFGQKFISKEDAIEYYERESNGVKILSEYSYKSNISLNDKNYNSLEEVNSEVLKEFPIKELKTGKNVEDYRIDRTGLLDSTVKENKENQLKIYKDANNEVVAEDDDELSIKKVIESHKEKITKKYIVDNNEFFSKEEISDYYNNKFLSSGKLDEQNLFNVGNGVYTENELSDFIDSSIINEYKYNGEFLNENSLSNPDNLNLLTTDKSRIQEINKSPGLYYLEVNEENASGTFIGDTMIEATEDVRDFIKTESNWQSSSVSGSAMDAITSLIASGVNAVINKIMTINSATQTKDEDKLEILLGKSNSINLENVFKIYSNNEGYNEITKLIEKYNITADLNQSTTILNSINNLDFNRKSTYFLYQIREAFRYRDISVNDFKILKNIYKTILLNLNDKTDTEWIDFVNEVSKNDVMFVLDYMIKPTNFSNNLKSWVNAGHVRTVLMKLLEKAKEKLLLDPIEQLKKTAKALEDSNFIHFAEEALEHAKKLEKILTGLNFAIQILDLIPVSKTTTYKLKIPNSDIELSYQITNYFNTGEKFNPSKIFNVVEIKKPFNDKMYYLNGQYFTNLDSAISKLKFIVRDEIISNKPYRVYSNFFLGEYFDDRESLIETLKNKIIKENRVPQKYTDFFGNVFNNSDDALVSMHDNISKNNFKMKYTYEFNNMKLYSYNYEELVKKITNNMSFEYKQTEYTELIENELNYDNIDDLSILKTTIYSFDFNGLEYLFDSYIGAYSYLLKLNGFKNILNTYKTTKYIFNNIEFENIVYFENYLLGNIKMLEEDKNV